MNATRDELIDFAKFLCENIINVNMYLLEDAVDTYIKSNNSDPNEGRAIGSNEQTEKCNHKYQYPPVYQDKRAKCVYCGKDYPLY